MEQSNLLNQLTPKSYVRLGLTILLILFAGRFVINDALPYFGFEKATFGSYWDFRWPLIGHISGGLIALTLGPFQFWKSFRNKFINTHRWMGRIYLTAILIGTISASYLAWTSAIRVNFSWALGLQSLAFAWITTSSMAYIAVRQKRILQHKEWMIRSYVVTFAFVTFRWLTDLPIAIQVMNKFEERGPTIIWLSWTIPLLITEIVLSWKKK